MKKNLTIMGLDLSLTGTGLVVIQNGELKRKELIAVKTKGIERLGNILALVKNAVTETTETIGRIDLAVIEDYSFGSRGCAIFSSGELGGVIRLYLYLEKNDFLLVSPATLKKYVAGKGNADKDVMLKEVFKKWGQDFDDDNIADAYSLARAGELFLQSDTKKLKTHELEVKKTLTDAKERYYSFMEGGE